MTNEVSTGSPTRQFSARLLAWLATRGPLALFVAVVAVSALAQTAIGWDNFTDLDVYRSTAVGVRHGVSLYDGGFGRYDLPWTYPPFAAIVFLPMAFIPAIPLALLWFALNVFLLLDSCFSLRRWADREGWRPFPPLLLAGCALLFEPVTSTLGFGQVNLVLLALLLRDASGRTPFPQGVLTGLCAGFKLTPAAFGLYYLLTGRLAAVRNATLTGLATIGISAIFLPSAFATFWLDRTFADSSRPGAVYYIYNQSLTGMWTRWLPVSTGERVAMLMAIPVVLLAGWIAWRAHRQGRDLLAFAAVTTVPLLISPISWSHHWVSMIVPIVALFAAPWAVGRRPRLILFWVLVVVFASRAMNVLPRERDRELDYGFAGNLLSSSYTLAALAFLVMLAWELRPGRDSPEAEGIRVALGRNGAGDPIEKPQSPRGSM